MQNGRIFLIAATIAVIAISSLGAVAVVVGVTGGSRDERPREGVPLDPDPPFRGSINGIEVVPVATEGASDKYCPSGQAANAAYAVVIGSPYAITPSYLPAGATEENAGYVPDPRHDDFVPVTLCDGEPARSFRQYVNTGEGASWVELSISKLATDSIVIDASEQRLSPTSVNDKPALIIRPAERDDLGEAFVIIQEPFGQTRLRGLGLPAEELLKVAEGLK